MKKYIIAFFGMSGVGKTYAQHYLKNKYHIPLLVTHTTRSPRKNEKNGIDYYFDTKKQFFNKNKLLEYTKVSNNYYGSALNDIQKLWKHHQIISITLDINGIKNYLAKLKSSVIPVYLFSNTDTIKGRLIKRNMPQREIKARFKVHQHRLSKEYSVIFNPKIHTKEIDTTVWHSKGKQLEDEQGHLDNLVKVLKQN